MSVALRSVTCVAVLLVAGCAERVSVVGRLGLGSDAGEDAGVAVTPWGTWAAQLPVPACPAGVELVVDTVADELEGGASLTDRAQAGERLSLPEALWLAANQAGPHVIRFAPAVFPVDAPATITLEGTHALPQGLTDTCLDGRERGVVVHWAHAARVGADTDLPFLWGLGANSLQVGLELRAIEQGQAVEAGAQVAGCRYFSLPGDHLHPVSVRVRLTAGTLGPGVVMVGSVSAVSGSHGTVRGSFFGYDPRSGVSEPVAMGLMLGGAPLVEGNVFSSIFQAMYFSGDALTFRHNFVGAHPQTLAPLELHTEAVSLLFPQGSVIGPGNVLRATWRGVHVQHPGVVTVTRNRIYAHVPIDHTVDDGAPLAPVITAGSNGAVLGTCAAAGRVELFSGTERSVEDFLGETPCAAGAGWSLPATAAAGATLWATVTDATGNTSDFSAPFVVP